MLIEYLARKQYPHDQASVSHSGSFYLLHPLQLMLIEYLGTKATHDQLINCDPSS